MSGAWHSAGKRRCRCIGLGFWLYTQVSEAEQNCWSGERKCESETRPEECVHCREAFF